MSTIPAAAGRSGSQTLRDLRLHSPFGDALLFRSFSGEDRLGEPYAYRVELLSTDPGLDPDAVLGHNFTVEVQRVDGKPRYFDGYVTEFAQTGTLGHYMVYEAVLSPWLWFLTRTSDSRIFQGLSIPDIVQQVFREHGYPVFSAALFESYAPWDFCVQYRETDFAFVSRLLEREGIYYYFRHELGSHELVLCDSPSSHDAAPGCESLPYMPPSESGRPREYVSALHVRKRVQPDCVALNDYDFRRPRLPVTTQAIAAHKHQRPA